MTSADAPETKEEMDFLKILALPQRRGLFPRSDPLGTRSPQREAEESDKLAKSILSLFFLPGALKLSSRPLYKI